MSKKKKNDDINKLTFGDKDAHVVKVDPNQKKLIVVQCQEDQFLAVAWDIDDAGYGFWRIRQIGCTPDGEFVKKELTPGKPAVAFYGEAALVGAGGNDLYTSYGYEDADEQDVEGNVVNKIQEVRVFPKRED